MPLIKAEQYDQHTKILIWHITESNEYFEKKLSKYFTSPYPWKNMIPKRRREYLASRYILQKALPPPLTVADYIKDQNGAPRIRQSPVFIGISHCEKYTACIISNRRTGCDIEVYQDRILKLSDKFMTPKDQNWAAEGDPVKRTHLMWGIKESSYKTWAKRGIDWIKDIHVDSISEKNSGKGKIKGRIGKKAHEIHYHGEYQYFDDFIFVWTLEV